jgi:catechol 2,3-dioxygenase-like lactoylglutathione lyase family enzyme
MFLDHIDLSCSDYEQTKAFFAKAPAPIGISMVSETHGWAGFGRDGRPQFGYGIGAGPQKPMHIAFTARSRAEVFLSFTLQPLQQVLLTMVRLALGSTCALQAPAWCSECVHGVRIQQSQITTT